MAFTLLRRGRLIPVPPVEKALRFLGRRTTRRGRAAGARSSARRTTVRAGIEEVAAEYGAEEVIVVTITYDHAARRRSYELIAEAFGLGGAAEGPAADDAASKVPPAEAPAAEGPASERPAAEEPVAEGSTAAGR